MQADLAAQVEDDEEEKRLWAGRGVGRGPLWVEGGEKRGQVSCILHFVALCIMLFCMLCCRLCCSVVPAVAKGRREAQAGVFCRCLFLHYIGLFCGSFV